MKLTLLLCGHAIPPSAHITHILFRFGENPEPNELSQFSDNIFPMRAKTVHLEHIPCVFVRQQTKNGVKVGKKKRAVECE